MIKAALLDFDGTLVTQDMSVLLAEKLGKGAESRKSVHDFHSGKSKGISGLVERVNMLSGLKLADIEAMVHERNYLMPGARELTDYFHDNGIITVLASGSILPVLEFYQRNLLKVDYVIGSRVHIHDGVLAGIAEADFPDPDFKLFESKKILEALGISATETMAIGDSPGDRSRFEFAQHAVAINPKEGIERFADYTIHNDLYSAIYIVKELNTEAHA